jgi:hypothetical protein
MKYLCIIIVIIGISCSQNNKIEVEYIRDFPEVVSLSHEKIATAPNLYCVGGMVLMDSVLVTVDLKADTFFQVLKLPDYKNIGSYTLKGFGPEDENTVDPFIRHISGNSFFYKNLMSVKIMNFNLKTNKMELTEKIDIPTELMELWHIFKLGDSIIGCNLGNETAKEFVGFNAKTKEKFDFGDDYPDIGEKIEGYYKNMIFAKTSIIKPDGSAFASVYDKFPILRIYSKEGELKKEVRYVNNQSSPHALTETNPSEESLKNIMQNYRKIKSSNRYIYALYIGKTMKDVSIGLEDFSNEIHVWDWCGKPIAKILLDKKIFSFDVDPMDRYLICASLNSLDELYKYYLKIGY